MVNQQFRDLLLVVLAILFSFALMFAFIELPRQIDLFLQTKVGFPGFDHGSNALNAYKTDVVIDSLYLRWMGCGSLLIIVLLENPNSDIREFSVQVFGELQATDAVASIIPLLTDSEFRVRRSLYCYRSGYK